MNVFVKVVLFLGVVCPTWIAMESSYREVQLCGGDGSEPTAAKKYECFTHCEGDDKCAEVATCHHQGGTCVMVKRYASFHCVEVEDGTMRSCSTEEETGTFGGEVKNLGCILTYRNPCDASVPASCTRLVDRCGKRTICE